MTNVQVWFERKFDFTFPFPNLCVRLRGTPARLEEMQRDVSREGLVAFGDLLRRMGLPQ